MKVIYSGVTSKYWQLVIEGLAEENQWSPIYVVGSPGEIQDIKNRFPDVVTHIVVDAVKGIPSEDFKKHQFKPLDTKILKEFEACQVVLLRMMDRIDALGSFSYNDRTRLFHKLLRYWKTVVDDLQPDIVVFSVIPHMVYDYVLYVLCQQYHIPMVMFESIPVRGRTLIMDAYDQPTRTQLLYQRLQEEGDLPEVSPSAELDDYLRSLKGSYQNAPDYVRRVYKEKPYKGVKDSSKSLFSKLVDFGNYRRYLEKQKKIIQSKFKIPPNYLKQKNKKLEDSHMNYFQHKMFRFLSHLKMRALIRYYHQLTDDPNIANPYIYVALSFQPERTTSPMGSIFVDQFLMIDLLSKTVPDGWHIYVKEHPFQYTPSMFYRSQSGKTRELYDDIVALPNVSLVPMPINSYQLIDHAKAVAAVTGTVGWETVHRGKPALIFGYPWYRGCEGIFHITTQDSLLSVLESIKSGYQVDVNKLRLFAYALEKTTIEASVESHLQITKIKEEERAAILTKAIQEFAA